MLGAIQSDSTEKGRGPGEGRNTTSPSGRGREGGRGRGGRKKGYKCRLSQSRFTSRKCRYTGKCCCSSQLIFRCPLTKTSIVIGQKYKSPLSHFLGKHQNCAGLLQSHPLRTGVEWIDIFAKHSQNFTWSQQVFLSSFTYLVSAQLKTQFRCCQ